MFSLKIGLLSGSTPEETLKSKYERLVGAIEAHSDLDLLCTGELFLLGENLLDFEDFWAELAVILEDIQLLANKKDLAIVVGYPYKVDCEITIRQSVYLPNVSPFHYDKVHLGKNEQVTYVPGDKIEVFSYKDFCFGIQVCIDTHVPDMTLMQKLKGVEVILAPFNTPYSTDKRIANWKKYIPTKGYDYNLCVCCTNTGGGSFAVDGYGKVLVESDAKADLQVVTINKSVSFNKRIDYMSYRRPGIYEYE